MGKYFKAALYIALYALIYISFMFFCQLAFGLTIGGAGAALLGLFSQEAPASPEQIMDAVSTALDEISNYVERNTSLIFSISALLTLLVFNKIFAARKIDFFTSIRINKPIPAVEIKHGAYAGASANFVISVIVMLLQSAGLFTDAFSQYDAHFDSIFGTGGALAAVLGFGLIVPVVEEIMFRGMITYELTHVSKRNVAIAAQGVIFGLFHFVPVQIVYTTPLGIYFGIIAYKCGSIWPAIAGHISMNMVAIILSAPAFAPLASQPMFALIFAAASIYMFVKALIFFIKKDPVE
ncbi:MAG: CPBP family intramembrane metalloprotease [Oscillospiraceae bacterium]|nr:CPBP family intramembrane metalloprotease [Oscillospiraceae bacterium]